MAINCLPFVNVTAWHYFKSNFMQSYNVHILSNINYVVLPYERTAVKKFTFISDQIFYLFSRLLKGIKV